MVTELMCLEQDNTILTLDRTVENSAVRQWSRAQESLWKQSLAEKVSLYHLKVFGHMIFFKHAAIPILRWYFESSLDLCHPKSVLWLIHWHSLPLEYLRLHMCMYICIIIYTHFISFISTWTNYLWIMWGQYGKKVPRFCCFRSCWKQHPWRLQLICRSGKMVRFARGKTHSENIVRRGAICLF